MASIFLVRPLTCLQFRREHLNSEEQNRMEQAVSPKLAAEYRTGVAYTAVNNESNSSGVSWAAVIGGGFVTAAISHSLLSLGAGLAFPQYRFGRTREPPPRPSAWGLFCG
jgi:hypothetical protein